jgi:hypothetical protein
MRQMRKIKIIIHVQQAGVSNMFETDELKINTIMRA